MRKTIIGVVAIVLLLLVGGSIYFFGQSYHANIKKAGFHKNDIVTSIEYSTNDDLFKVVLMEGDDTLGLALLKKGKWNTWSTVHTSTVADASYNNEIASISLNLMDVWDAEVYSKQYVFLTKYVTEDEVDLNEPTPLHFKVNDDVIKRNGKNMLFLQAIADEDVDRFGSEEVISFLELGEVD